MESRNADTKSKTIACTHFPSLVRYAENMSNERKAHNTSVRFGLLAKKLLRTKSD